MHYCLALPHLLYLQFVHLLFVSPSYRSLLPVASSPKGGSNPKKVRVRLWTLRFLYEKNTTTKLFGASSYVQCKIVRDDQCRWISEVGVYNPFTIMPHEEGKNHFKESGFHTLAHI